MVINKTNNYYFITNHTDFKWLDRKNAELIPDTIKELDEYYDNMVEKQPFNMVYNNNITEKYIEISVSKKCLEYLEYVAKGIIVLYM